MAAQRSRKDVRRQLFPICTGAILLACPTAYGDTLIESTRTDGGFTRVVLGAGKARIDTSDEGTYVLLDLATRKALVVDAHAQFAMDLDSPRPQRSEHARMAAAGAVPPEVRLDDMGDGPAIAGYPTRRYRVLVNNVHCYDEYLAMAPLQEPAIRLFVEATAAAPGDEESRALMLLTEPERLCEAANNLIDDHYPRLGIPLRSTDSGGKTAHEITRIQLDAPARPALLEVPAGYPVLTRAQVSERLHRAEPAAAEQQRPVQDRIEDAAGQRRASPAGGAE